MKKLTLVAAAGILSVFAMSQASAAFLTIHNKTNCGITVQTLGGHDVQSLSAALVGVPSQSSTSVQITLGEGASFAAYSYENFTITANGSSGFNSWLGTVKATNKSGLYDWDINLKDGVHTELFTLNGVASDGNNVYTLTITPSAEAAGGNPQAIERYGAFCAQ